MFVCAFLAIVASAPVLAQTSNATFPTCPFDRESPTTIEISSPNITVNSTGSVAFSFPSQDPWYLSVLVNNTRGSSFSRQSFLSVKDDAQNASVCLYQFSALNTTSAGGGCTGVFSDQCRDHLQQLFFNGSNALYKPGGLCPLIWTGSREDQVRIRDLCGRISGNDLSPNRFTVPNDTCNYPTLPGVDLPDGYQSPYSSSAMRGSYSFFGDEPASTYDLYAQQVVPFAVVASFEGNQNNAVQFVCVTPNNTQSGSQTPAERPWESNTSVASGYHVAGRLAMGVAGLIGLTLAL